MKPDEKINQISSIGPNWVIHLQISICIVVVSPLIPAQKRSSFSPRLRTKFIVSKVWCPLVMGNYQFNSYVSSLFLSRTRLGKVIHFKLKWVMIKQRCTNPIRLRFRNVTFASQWMPHCHKRGKYQGFRTANKPIVFSNSVITLSSPEI